MKCRESQGAGRTELSSKVVHPRGHRRRSSQWLTCHFVARRAMPATGWRGIASLLFWTSRAQPTRLLRVVFDRRWRITREDARWRRC